MNSNPDVIRPADASDVEAIYQLTRELAEYEKLLHEVRGTAADLHAFLFADPPRAEAWVAVVEGHVAGFAMAFTTVSTFRGRPGFYLEDIYVQPAHRGRGIGRALLTNLASVASHRGYGRLEWSVLNWNESAIGFYRSLGARPMAEWTVYRLEDDALDRLAGVEGRAGESRR